MHAILPTKRLMQLQMALLQMSVKIRTMNAGGWSRFKKTEHFIFCRKKELCQIFTGIFGKSVYASIASHKSVDSLKLAT